MPLISILRNLWWPRTVTATLGSTPFGSDRIMPVDMMRVTTLYPSESKKLMTVSVIGFLALFVIPFTAQGQIAKESGWELSIANGLVLFKQKSKQTPSQGRGSEASESAGSEVAGQTASEPDYFMPAIKSHLKADISGIVTCTTITQTFRNPYDEWLDGTYQFPLPEDAAVDGLLMRIGQREIVGEIKEKQVAKAIFNKAKANGQKASLVNQVKANMFTTKLANIAPYEEIQIEIQLQQKARYKNGEFQLRFPTTYTPRFGESEPSLSDVREPGVSAAAGQLTSGAVGAGATEYPSGNFSFDINLDAGDSLNYVASPHFDVQVEGVAHHRKHISSAFPQSANRDLEILWQYKGASPKLLHYREADSEGEYGLVMLLPGETETRESQNNSETFTAQTQRDVTLIIDTSSSMAGASIRQAKAALSLAVSVMQPWDKFNLVEFNSEAIALWSQPQEASQANIAEAMNFLNHLEARGGTNIYSALDLALSTQGDASQRETSTLQQIVFITDGAIGYEEQLLRELSERIGEARLFTVGIGSAPNSYFMVEAAKSGRGTFTHIASLDQVKSRMAHLLTQLAKPAITDLALDLGMEVEQYPEKLPDLYFNEPLVVAYKAPQAVLDIWARGKIAGSAWEAYRQTDYLQDSAGISKLWANEKIRQLMTERRLVASTGGTSSQDSKDQLRDEIVSVALQHGLVSKFTSLVAVERQISNPGLTAEKVKFGHLSPANRQALMQSMPQTATTANQSFLLALCFLVAFIFIAFNPRITGKSYTEGDAHVS